MKNRIIHTLGAVALVAGMALTGTTAVMAGENNYTYVYDYWGDVQESPDVYSVAKVFTYNELGLDTNLKAAESMFVYGNQVYICDTGNNRIVVVERSGTDDFQLVREITKIKGADIAELNAPADVAVSDDGYIFIADRGNARILKVDMDLNYVMQFDTPVDSAIASDYVFQPDKLVIDTAGRVYCSAKGINKGLVKYEADGTFSGFVGATRVAFNFTDYIWKKFASQEQRAQMESFVPTEYDNVFIDKEGFIYAVVGGADEEALDNETVDAVRKLNMLGTDILVRNGEYPVYGDLYWSGAGGITGPSYFKDVTVLDNDVYICMDQNRGRLFGYDDQGRMVFAFGGNGNMDGYFRKPVSMEHMGNDLMVLDQTDCSITLFVTTEYGDMIYRAMDQFDQGLYDEAEASWNKVKTLNGNYELAYIGIGRSLMRKGQYKEAMEYFEAKYDEENYSRAYAQYRKAVIRENILWVIVVLLVIILIPLVIGRYFRVKAEIERCEIFKL